jgi:guanylate kinase
MSEFLRPLVISGPSGVGKSTLLRRLFADFPEKFGFSVSRKLNHPWKRPGDPCLSLDTTRSPRQGETHGKQYFFVDRQSFGDLIQASAFVEHAEFSGNFYGTSFDAIHQIQQQGRRCILDIEAQVRSKPQCLSAYQRILGYPPNQSNQSESSLPLHLAAIDVISA